MKFLTPKDLSEVLELVSRNPNYPILAGGTDLCVAMNSGQLAPEGLINIWGLDELRGIKEMGDSIEIGALTTHTEIFSSDIIGRLVPSLTQACRTVGARQIQNRGTIGGNIMNASPAGDTLPVLLAHDALVETRSVNGARWIPFADFYKGYRVTALNDDEIVTRIKVPKPTIGEKSAFMKIGTRKAQAISKVMGCFRISFDGDKVNEAAIAFGSVAPVPVRLPKTERLLIGKRLDEKLIKKARASVVGEVNPIDDIRSTADYRRHICGILIKRFLE